MLRSARAFLKSALIEVLIRNGAIGLDAIREIRRDFPHFTFETVFDVGANVGETALALRRMLPAARIYAFEPSRRNFAALRQALQDDARARCFALALADAPGAAQFFDDPNHTMSRIVNGAGAQGATYDVEVTTLDAFCAAQGIPRIGYLKIDVEGHELRVLKGAEGLLKSQSISFIEVECGASAKNTYHVKFEDLKSVLEAQDYVLFGIYEQVSEWPTGRPALRRVNAVFVSERDVALNKKHAPEPPAS